MNVAHAFKVFAMTSALSLVAVGCSSEAGEDPIGESEDHLLAGTRLMAIQVATHLRAAGFPEEQIGRMVCTAKYESSFYERAQNRNRNGSIDRGLFQINSSNLSGHHGCPTRSNAATLWDPVANTQCAYYIYTVLGNQAWYGYQHHQAECDAYPAPDSGDAPSLTDPGTNAGAPTADADAGADKTDPTSSDEGHEGGCWSSTLNDMVEPRTCVQSSKDNVWYQCMDGGWYRGGDATTGNFGACRSSHSL